MTQEQKNQISREVAAMAAKSSQNKLATKAGVSAATISQIINGNWSLIAPEMWRKVQINLKLSNGWNTGETTNFKNLTRLLMATQVRSLSIAISYNAGAGKSHTYREYDRRSKNVFHLECKKTWSLKSYVTKLLQTAGLEAKGTVEEMIGTFTEHMACLENPMVIIDQADKLKDAPFDLFMDMYNDLEGHCAFVISGVPALKKRIEKGVQNDKPGYAEFWSRVGSKFIPLDPVTLKDVKAICEANGVSDELFIRESFNTCMGDIRSVKRDVERYYLLKSEAA